MLSQSQFQYRDITYPKFAPYATRRIPQIFEKPEFYVQGADYSDVVQGTINHHILVFSLISDITGALGDCWFLSAIAAVGTKQGLIEKLCVAVRFIQRSDVRPLTFFLIEG